MIKVLATEIQGTDREFQDMLAQLDNDCFKCPMWMTPNESDRVLMKLFLIDYISLR